LTRACIGLTSESFALRIMDKNYYGGGIMSTEKSGRTNGIMSNVYSIISTAYAV
jgi:hypothetical protein